MGEGPGGLYGAGDGRVSRRGAGSRCAREGWFGARRRKPVGLVLAGPAGEGWWRDEGVCVERGMAK